MIVIGAGGFAKELLQILISERYVYKDDNLFFFDDISENTPEKFYGKYQILTSYKEVKEIIQIVSPEFCLGIGGPQLRYLFSKKIVDMGGKLKSLISQKANVGTFDVSIGEGVIIMQNSTVTNSVKIGKGTIINFDCTVGHDVEIGQYSEIMPGVNISGNCKIGSYTSLGSGVVVTSKVTIGNNCFVAAGSVVTKDIPDNSFVVGVIPSRIVSRIPDFEE